VTTVATPGSARARSLAERVLQDPGGAADPQGDLAPIRESEPVFVGDGGVVLVTGYDEARATYADSARYSNAGGMDREAEWYERYATDPAEAQLARTMFASMMFTSDGDDHARRRALVREFFSVRAVAALRPTVDSIVAELIDEVRHVESFEALRMLGFPLAERVICEILGAPFEDFHLWEEWARVIGEFPRTRQPTEIEVQDYVAASMGFLRYFESLIDKRRTSPGDDLISHMIAAADDERMSPDELVANIVLIINAGHDTTANMVVNGLDALLRHPDQYRALRDDPDLVPSAVEEMLRYEPSASFPFPRRATAPGEVAGCPVPQGAMVLIANHAAGRDERVFEEPDRLDVRRYVGRGATPHLAFGFGIHRCVGEHLARAELESMFRAIVTELPELEIVVRGAWRHGFHRHMEGLYVRRRDARGAE
jgi:cytochrome P450